MRKDRDETPDPLQPALIVTYGNTSRKRRPLDKPVLVLGRMQGCDLPLMSPDVAPVHCIIVRLANGWRIRDCSGHLGTRVNGKNITEEPLGDEDHLQIGPFNFKVHLPPRSEAVVTLKPQEETEKSPPADLLKLQEQLGRERGSRANLIRLARLYRHQAHTSRKEQKEIQTILERDLRDISADRSDLERDWDHLEKSARSLRARELEIEKAEKAIRERFKSLEEELQELRSKTEEEVRQARAQHEGVVDDQKQQALANLEQAQREVADQREHLDHQCESLDQTRLQMEQTRAELEKSRLEIEEARAQAEADQQRARAILSHAETASRELNERERELSQREAELEKLSANLRASASERQHEEVGSKTHPTEEVQAEISAALEIHQLQVRLAQMEQENTALRERLNTGTNPGSIQVLHVEDGSLRQSLEESRQQLEQLKLIADSLHRENEELRKKLPTGGTPDTLLGSVAPSMIPRSELEASEAAYAALQMQLKHLQVERDLERSRSREQVEHLRRENDVLRNPAVIFPPSQGEDAVSPFQDQIKRIQGEREEEQARFRAQIAELRQEIEILRQGVSVDSTDPRPIYDSSLLRDAEISGLNKEVDRLRMQLKDMHQENEILKQQQQAPATVPLEAKEAMAEQARQIDRLRQEVLRLQSEKAGPADSDNQNVGAPVELQRQVEVLKERLIEMQVDHEAQRRLLEQQIHELREASSSGALPSEPLVSEEELRQLVAQIDLLHDENEQLRRQTARSQSNEMEVNSKARTICLLEQQIQTLQGEMLRIQKSLEEREEELGDLNAQIADSRELRTIQELRLAVERLQEDIKDRDALIEKLSVELDSPTPGGLEISGGYERELHQFRLELERDRRLVSEQLEELRQRQEDMAEAAREMELQMAKERAALARERTDLVRMREEIRMDQERLERQGAKRPGGSSIAQLRETLNQSRSESPGGNGKRR